MPSILVVQPEAQAARIDDLEARLRAFAEFALAHDEFEGMMLGDDSPWFEAMPEAIYAKMMEVQRLRGVALGLSRT